MKSIVVLLAISGLVAMCAGAPIDDAVENPAPAAETMPEAEVTVDAARVKRALSKEVDGSATKTAATSLYDNDADEPSPFAKADSQAESNYEAGSVPEGFGEESPVQSSAFSGSDPWSDNGDSDNDFDRASPSDFSAHESLSDDDYLVTSPDVKEDEDWESTFDAHDDPESPVKPYQEKEDDWKVHKQELLDAGIHGVDSLEESAENKRFGDDAVEHFAHTKQHLVDIGAHSKSSLEGKSPSEVYNLAHEARKTMLKDAGHENVDAMSRKQVHEAANLHMQDELNKAHHPVGNGNHELADNHAVLKAKSKVNKKPVHAQPGAKHNEKSMKELGKKVVAHANVNTKKKELVEKHNVPAAKVKGMKAKQVHVEHTKKEKEAKKGGKPTTPPASPKATKDATGAHGSKAGGAAGGAHGAAGGPHSSAGGAHAAGGAHVAGHQKKP